MNKVSKAVSSVHKQAYTHSYKYSSLNKHTHTHTHTSTDTYPSSPHTHAPHTNIPTYTFTHLNKAVTNLSASPNHLSIRVLALIFINVA